MAMDVEAKTKWLEALRSGEYTQGKMGLRNNATNAYCCLGVLCDVQNVVRKLPNGRDWFEYTFRMGEDLPDYHNDAIVPAGFCGLEGDEIWRLSRLNDNEDKTFSEIADYIEANL